jgi:hypothetical protein
MKHDFFQGIDMADLIQHKVVIYPILVNTTLQVR